MHESRPFRTRLFDGLASSIAEHGYRATTVADIVRHARTSKRTFYSEFTDKEECFVELLRADHEQLLLAIRTAVNPESDWREQVRQAATAYVDHIGSRPGITLSWIRELPALGTTVRSIQRAAMSDLTDLLIDLSDSPGFRRAELAPVRRELAVVLLGGLRELTALTVEDKLPAEPILEPAVLAAEALLSAGSAAPI